MALLITVMYGHDYKTSSHAITELQLEAAEMAALAINERRKKDPNRFPSIEAYVVPL